MPKKQAFIDKSGVKFVENFQKNQKIKKFPSRTEIRYLTAFMQKSQFINFRTIQFSWPLGMPLVRKIDTNLWASRSKLTNGIARVFFTVKGNTIIL